MHISELFQPGGEPVFSFEFFPPKTDKGHAALLATIEELAPLRPGFVSVTYGAGGSTRDLTIDLVTRIKQSMGIEAMAHLTCVGASESEIEAVLDRLEAAGIENVIALRGDPPQGETDFVPHPDGLAHADDLVSLIREQGRPFCVAAAAYPEGHVESADAQTDLDHLARKVRAGTDFLITQLFFDNDFYFAFADKARNAGIEIPIVAGIMPVTNVAQIERFTKMLAERLDPVREDSDAVERVGIEFAIEQCRGLIEGGVPGIHFYTLNKSGSTREILRALRRLESPTA
jgi:methylenetetrahydrofolate reductase (NADPH)